MVAWDEEGIILGYGSSRFYSWNHWEHICQAANLSTYIAATMTN